MSSMDWLEPYILLITSFVSGDISASKFEASYLELFKKETCEMPEDIYAVLNDLFCDADAYCSDPELRDDDDLSESQLLSSATNALQKLR